MVLTEQQKIRQLYDLIGERRLYVSTNFDVFEKKPLEIQVITSGYKLPLIQEGTKAYSSPLLFATLTSLMHQGTMYITGAPGIGKTTAAEYAGHFFGNTPYDDILEAEILGNPQLKTEDVVASLDTVKMVHDGEKLVLPTNFLKCPIKIMDEVNRTPADLLSCTMKLVDIGKAVYQGVLLESPPGVLFATANYVDEGTFPLTPPFLDRFDVAVMMTSPQPWDLGEIRKRGDEKLDSDLGELLIIPDKLKPDFEKIRKQIREMPEAMEYDCSVPGQFADFVYGSLRFSEIASDKLVRGTKGNAWEMDQNNAANDKELSGHFRDAPFNYTVNELSVRTARAMMRYAKAFAWFKGKDVVEIDDLKTVLPYLLWHKVQPTEKAYGENQRYKNDRISFVEDLILKIENEFTEMKSSEAWRIYGAVMKVIETEKIKDDVLDSDALRQFVKKAIAKIGSIDKQWAIMLTSHIASYYNGKCILR